MTTDTDPPSLNGALELRILHGPQAGSTLPFEPGQSYLLGTSDTCAVLLAGTQLEQEHATLTAGNDGIQVEPNQGRVMTIDRGEVSSGQVFALGTVLRLGRVKLTVDQVDAPWPQDEALEEPDLPAAPDPAEPSEEEDAGEHAEENEQAQEQEAHTLPLAPLSRPALPASRRLMPIVLLGAGAMLLMGAAVAAWVTSERVDPPVDGAEVVVSPPLLAGSAPASAEPFINVSELARQFPEATLNLTRAPGGKWLLQGRISSEEGLHRLREMAAAMPQAPEVRVFLDSERLAAVMQFADRHRVEGQMHLTVEPRPGGVLRIGGAAATQAALNGVVEAANTELVGMAPLEFAVLLRPEVSARFESRLRASGLAPKFKVLRRDSELELQALLTSQEVRTWENLFVDFTRDYGSVLTVRLKVKHERDAMDGLIETVVAGPFPYVVTTSGQRIAPGGVIDGRTLVAIRGGELVFSDGLRVRYGS